MLREIVQDFSAHGVRVYVLSFNIIGHYWSEANTGVVARNAWVARTIDQLSREFDVVFVTITGNIDKFEVVELHGESAYPSYFSAPLAKLLDPGQAALAVTAGSVAHSSRVVVKHAFPKTEEGKPSPFTRSGPGFGNAIKPDFVERGGNFAVASENGTVVANPATNVVMASNRLTPALVTDSGTSFAAPRVAHHLAVIASGFKELGIAPRVPKSTKCNVKLVSHGDRWERCNGMLLSGKCTRGNTVLIPTRSPSSSDRQVGSRRIRRSRLQW